MTEDFYLFSFFINSLPITQLQVSLKTHRTKAGLIKAVTKIEPLSTGTMTGLAIQFALNVAFSESEGARVKSPDISKVTRMCRQFDLHHDYPV